MDDTKNRLLRELYELIAPENRDRAREIIEEIRPTRWTQSEIRDDLYLNEIQREQTRIGNIHINFIQGLIRTKFLADASAKCRALKVQTNTTNASNDEDVNTIKEKASRWVVDQMENQSPEFLRQHCIELTEYQREAKTFHFQFRYRQITFDHFWPFDFTLLYGS